ncbi:MAG: ISAs1 family transposase [Anaerolineae bacterium]|nr:ISAs1 family transposase [Anaerolineae bacterium]MCO5190470.1 ISAs1 family transposase [Anaerolineae bacterium]MCO5194338.1 ISAs1 family transposase [Anaerolineae bacterium]
MFPNRTAPIADYFEEVEDPRRREGTRHPLITVITIALCAVIAHADSWPAVEEYARSKESWFRQFLEMPHGVPTQYTFRRVFLLLDPVQLQNSFMQWISDVQEMSGGDIIAIDGKAIRRAFTKGGKKGAIRMVNAWSEANRLVLGQVKVDAKSNEITAIPHLLDMLLLKGCIVTIDAMGCQREIARQVIDLEGDYLLALKKNQGTLFEDVDHLFHFANADNFDQPNMDYVDQVSKGHGRVEIRRCWVIADPEWLAFLRRKHHWPELRSIVKVTGRRSTDDKRRKPDTRYYITSLEPDAQHILAATRSHWGVENKVHWVLDIAFREDESRLRKGNGQENMAALRRWALNLIRQEDSVKASIAVKRLKAGWDNTYMEKILFGK